MASECEGKASYPTKYKADAAITSIRNNRNRTMQIPRYSYKCPHGDHYHLSSNPDPKALDEVLGALGLKEERP